MAPVHRTECLQYGSLPMPKWRNGRRAGLKNRWEQSRVGSNPTFGTSNHRPQDIDQDSL